MLRSGFEPAIPVSELSKTTRPIHKVTAVIGSYVIQKVVLVLFFYILVLLRLYKHFKINFNCDAVLDQLNLSDEARTHRELHGS